MFHKEAEQTSFSESALVMFLMDEEITSMVNPKCFLFSFLLWRNFLFLSKNGCLSQGAQGSSGKVFYCLTHARYT